MDSAGVCGTKLKVMKWVVDDKHRCGLGADLSGRTLDANAHALSRKEEIILFEYPLSHLGVTKYQQTLPRITQK